MRHVSSSCQLKGVGRALGHWRASRRKGDGEQPPQLFTSSGLPVPPAKPQGPVQLQPSCPKSSPVATQWQLTTVCRLSRRLLPSGCGQDQACWVLACLCLCEG